MQSNGTLSDMICRSLMLELERAGQIVLPPVRWINPNPLAQRRKPDPPHIDTTPWRANLSAVRPLEFRLVRRTAEEPLFNGLLEHYHFLGYTQPVGEHLKYMVCGAGRVVACLAWSSAPRHLGPRDRFIGWTAEARRRNIRFIAYNTRFLIPPWIQVPHLASHILGRMPLVLSRDWARIYGHPIYFVETFVDPQRFMDAVAAILKHELHRLLVDGIKYERLPGTGPEAEWEMALFKNKELAHPAKSPVATKSPNHPATPAS